MNSKKIFPLLLGLLMLALPAQLHAQKFELNPYGGAILTPNSINRGSGSFDLKEEGIYGIRGSYFLTRRLEIEGNFGYLNRFEFEGSDPESRAYLWEASGLYRFDLEKVKPFVTLGVGGITASVDEDAPGFFDSPTPVTKDGDTFFAFSYGGGVKAPRLWGPIGLRGDARGRTIPNFHGDALTWLEVTGGLTITIGK